jgi:hypothetical protein
MLLEELPDFDDLIAPTAREFAIDPESSWGFTSLRVTARPVGVGPLIR